MKAVSYFDVLICGGGLAGLTTAMLLTDRGYSVAVFEKKKYPSHKVCGEYLSREVGPLLDHLGIDVFSAGAVIVDSLHIQTRSGREINAPLTQGAWGLSRYALDHLFYKAAVGRNVTVFQDDPVRSVKQENGIFTIKTDSGFYSSRKIIGAFGKRDLLDRALKRDFLKKRTGYMAVKYHVDGNFPKGRIGLYPFRDGFAGIVNVEHGMTCICYLMKRDNMKGYRSIYDMQKEVLYENPFLAGFIENSKPVQMSPLVINEISFTFKDLVKDDIYFTGDSAAMLAPVCGNGMAMALKGAILLSEAVDMDLKGDKSASRFYQDEWKKQFYSRLQTGKLIQGLLLNDTLLNVMIPAFNFFPRLSRSVISLTHGKEIALDL